MVKKSSPRRQLVISLFRMPSRAKTAVVSKVTVQKWLNRAAMGHQCLEHSTGSTAVVNNSSCSMKLLSGHSYGGSLKAISERIFTIQLTTGHIVTDEIYLLQGRASNAPVHTHTGGARYRKRAPLLQHSVANRCTRLA